MSTIGPFDNEALMESFRCTVIDTRKSDPRLGMKYVRFQKVLEILGTDVVITKIKDFRFTIISRTREVEEIPVGPMWIAMQEAA
ncbi:MAG: hypothetical protein HYZ63_02580 [Candidatus Andersenbacteria bacterium]|nr:hypothetical protein [Candidatus Andersenbacteria bacterium]